MVQILHVHEYHLNCRNNNAGIYMLKLWYNSLANVFWFFNVLGLILGQRCQYGHSTPPANHNRQQRCFFPDWVRLCLYSVHSLSAINSFFNVGPVTFSAFVSGEASMISASAVTEFATTCSINSQSFSLTGTIVESTYHRIWVTYQLLQCLKEPILQT